MRLPLALPGGQNISFSHVSHQSELTTSFTQLQKTKTRALSSSAKLIFSHCPYSFTQICGGPGLSDVLFVSNICKMSGSISFGPSLPLVHRSGSHPVTVTVKTLMEHLWEPLICLRGPKDAFKVRRVTFFILVRYFLCFLPAFLYVLVNESANMA